MCTIGIPNNNCISVFIVGKPEFPLSPMKNKGYETMEILNQTKFITDLT